MNTAMVESDHIDPNSDNNTATEETTVHQICILELNLSYTDTTLTLDFDLGTAEPATWGVWMLIPDFGIFPLWSPDLQPINPAVSFPIPIADFPSLGKVGILTALFTSEGITCSDWDTVDTGAPSSSTPAPEELRELFREVEASQVLSGE